MTLSKRRARILRVRVIEHRVAAARQSAAEQRVTELLGVARRLDDLRASLSPTEGATTGAMLQSKNELRSRLGRAETELQNPIRRAEDDHQQASSSRLLARAREEGAERLRNKAASAEDHLMATRLDANRPFRSLKEPRS
jgi:hypothetical protein